MMLSKIPVPSDTFLVEIITDKNNSRNHCIHYLNKHGDAVEDGVVVYDASIGEVVSLIPHMMKIHFTSDITETMPNVDMVFSRLSENREVRFDDVFDFQLCEDVVGIARMYCKLENVLNYSETTEYRDEKHIVDGFLDRGYDVGVLSIFEGAVV